MNVTANAAKNRRCQVLEHAQLAPILIDRAQPGVYANPSARLRGEIPFLVDLQGDSLSAPGTRLVAVDGVPVVPLAQEAGPIGARLLKGKVVLLRSHAHEIASTRYAVSGGN